MALVRPFRALRPTPEAAPRVAAVPYDVIGLEDARAEGAANPLSFLHVTRSEIDLPPGTDPYAPEVYTQASRNLERLAREAPLVIEPEESIYVYRLQAGAHAQRGVAACVAVDDYERDVIRKHERTRPDKEDDRTRHILATRAQTGVVFLTFRAEPALRSLVARVESGPPLFAFTAADGVAHTVWRADSSLTGAFVEAFAALPALYIADGHHRAAAAARARAALGRGGPADWFLAVAFPHDEVRILPYHRAVRDLAGHTPGSLLEALRASLPVSDGAPSPPARGRCGMYLAGRWYTLDLAGTPGARPADGPRVAAHAPAASPAAGAFDVELLQARVLEPVLGIHDPRSDPRLEFVGGAGGPAALEALVDAGRAAAAFAMYPVGVDDLMRVADAGGILPPKSTWFEPKLRDGLLVHLI